MRIREFSKLQNVNIQKPTVLLYTRNEKLSIHLLNCWENPSNIMYPNKSFKMFHKPQPTVHIPSNSNIYVEND